MPKVTKQSEGKGDAMVNTETGEETEMAEDVLRPIFSPLGVAELSGKKCEYRKVSGGHSHSPLLLRPPSTPPKNHHRDLHFFQVPTNSNHSQADAPSPPHTTPPAPLAHR
jgi:hypothetical protein